MKFAVLITCFNRVEKTLECLRHLYAASLPENTRFDVWLNDDCSTDGTGDRVKREFPSVNVISGSGQDYWCGGMRRVWGMASRTYDYDGYLWLNDDTLLNSDAMNLILNRNDGRSILVGAVCNKKGESTYGGEDEKGSVCPDGKWHKLRQMNGNVVWVPRQVFAMLGNFPSYLTHSLGDCDYSRRAREKGIFVYLTPSFIGTCEANDRVPAWKNPDAPLYKRLKSLYSPAGGSEPWVLFRYCFRHDGLFIAIKLLIGNHLRALLPGVRR